MKLFMLLILLFIHFSYSLKESQALLSNQEIKEILKCFGDLNLEEGCVICRYVTQKIYKVLDISAMCPDIVETKLLNQREREWKPDPQVINKWTVLYNLQKDYMARILPQIKAVQNYDSVMHQKLLKEKAEKQNLANLIQFQNKVNQDLQKETVIELGQKTFAPTNENCDDEKLAYQQSQVIAPEKLIASSSSNNVGANQKHLGDFNKMIFDSIQQKKINLHEGFKKDELNVANSSALQSAITNFINAGEAKSNFNFAEKGSSITVDDESKNNRNAEEKIKTKTKTQIQKTASMSNAPKNEAVNLIEKKSIAKPDKINRNFISPPKTDGKPSYPQKSKIKFPSTVPNLLEISSKVQTKAKSTGPDPVIDRNSDPYEQINKNISNPPQSFLQTGEIVTIDPQFMRAMKSNSNFNLETQRRGRRRSRFPDPQWDCAEAQIAKLVKYLCEEEISASYQKYCKPIFEQINTMIESYLYHDNHLEICQNLHMCPVTTDI